MDVQEKAYITRAVNEVMTKKLDEMAKGKQSVDWQRELNNLFQKIETCKDKIYTYGERVDEMNADIDGIIAKGENVKNIATSPIVSNTVAFCDYLKANGEDLSNDNIAQIVQSMISGLSYEVWKQKQVEGWGKNGLIEEKVRGKWAKNKEYDEGWR